LRSTGIAVLLGFGLWALIPSPALGTVFRVFGAGPRAIAMGGAFSAVADDFAGGYYNPGALTCKSGTRAGFAYQYAKLNLKANAGAIPLAHTHRDGFVLGYAFPLPFSDFLKDRIAIGYNLYQPPDYVMNITVPQPSQPQFVLLESYTQANLMNVAVGVKVVDGVSIGGGLTFAADVGGSLDLKPGIRSMQGAEAIMTTVDQDAQTVLSSSAGLYLDAGRLLPALKNFTFAFVWRDRYYIDLAIPVTILLGTIPLKLDFTSNLIYTPQMYTVGASWRPIPEVLIAAEITYNLWSDFLSPSLVIDTDISLPILPLQLLPGRIENPDFSNTLTTRMGVEFLALSKPWGDWILRAGYAYDPSPVPEQAGWSNFVDGNKHLFSLGLGFEHHILSKEKQTRTTIGIHTVFQLQRIEETRHTKTADIPRFDINPGYPEISGQGRVYFFGAGFTVEYGG